MENTKALIRSYVVDQMAVITHVQEAVSRHCQLDSVNNLPDALNLLKSIDTALLTAKDDLGKELETSLTGGGIEETWENALTNVSGFFTGLYGHIRTEAASRAFRDDATALNFLCTTYSMLFVTAEALGHESIALAANRGMTQFTPFVIKLAHTIPRVVVYDLRTLGHPLDETAVEKSIQVLSQAWHEASPRN